MAVPASFERSTSTASDATLAWVESPLQLLSVVEAHAAGILGPRTFLVPRSKVNLLDTTARHVNAMDLPRGLEIARPRRSIPRHSGAIALGDSFSGVAQSHLVTHPHDRIVLVDDGTATIEMMRLLTQPRTALTRSRRNGRSGTRAGRWLLGRVAASKLRSAARSGRLDIMTSMDIPPQTRTDLAALGARFYGHIFPWLRSQPSRDAPPEETIVLGSSLCHDGLIDTNRYLEWVLAKAANGNIAYYPHRREAHDVLHALNSHSRVRVAHTTVPVELSLRGLSPGQHISTLPSTAAVSLRLLLEHTGVRIEVADINDEWWTPAASPRLRRRLAMLNA